MTRHVTPKEASEDLGVSITTLRRWDKDGKIKSIRTPGGTRRFGVIDYEKDTKPTILSMQGSLPIPNEMTLNDKLNFCAQSTQQANLFERLDPGSTLSGENLSPFWSEFTRAISDALSAPIPIASFDSDSHWLSGFASKQEQNSWFSMNATSLQNRNSLKISCPSSIVSLRSKNGSEHAHLGPLPVCYASQSDGDAS